MAEVSFPSAGPSRQPSKSVLRETPNIVALSTGIKASILIGKFLEIYLEQDIAKSASVVLEAERSRYQEAYLRDFRHLLFGLGDGSCVLN